MSQEIVPLAITMMAGPQIMSAIIFVTSKDAVKLSLSFIAGAAIGVTVGVIVTKGIAALIGANNAIGETSSPSTLGKAIQIGLILLLLAGIVKNWRGRKTIESPKWLGALQEANSRRAFVVGLLLLTIFPSDAVVLLTVGFNLEDHGQSVVEALPFIGLTILIGALPFLSYMLFHRRAVLAMPKVRDWMNANSWLVNIIVFCIFIVLVL